MSKRSRQSQKEKLHTTRATSDPLAWSKSNAGKNLWAGLALFLFVLVAYWPALRGELLWDDAGHVTRPDLQSLRGLGRIWFEPGATQQYYPLLHSVFWLEHHLWGDATAGYHLANLIEHAIAACLFGVLLRRLAIPGAWLAAFIFALHPVAVESVAWISEQKNSLSLVFYLCAALAYLRFETERTGARYAVATVWFIAALCTKTVTASLPAALLVIHWWRHRQITRRDALPLLPWFAFSALGGWMTAHFEHYTIGARGADFALLPLERVLVAGRAFWFYLGKLFWPADLIFFYPRWTVSTAVAWQWIFPAAAIGLVAGLWFTRRRGLLAAVLLFGGGLFPALGFVNVYPFLFSFVADHFQYLACLAIIATAAAAMTTYAARFSTGRRWVGAAALLLVLGTVTWRQSATYGDVFVLYETTLEKNPDAWLAHNNLASVLTDAGRPAEAIPHLEQALKLRPNFPEAENNLGNDLRMLNRAAEALPHFEKALQLQPKFSDARNSYGMALMATGRAAEGMAQFEQAIKNQPGFGIAHLNLGLALVQNGRTPEAVQQFEQAVQAQPDLGEAEVQWGSALMLLGRATDAVPHFERALKLQPNSPYFHHTYARALAEMGRFPEALSHSEEAVALNPEFADAQLFLARLLQQAGRLEEAQQHAEAAEALKR